MSYIIIGLLMGFVFGWALEKSRVFEPGMIVGQMQLSNFIMLKVFLTAVATGLVVISALNGLGYANEMALRPQTLSGIVDSPAGLAAWILDHDADSYVLIARSFDGEPEGLTRDDIPQAPALRAHAQGLPFRCVGTAEDLRR